LEQGENCRYLGTFTNNGFRNSFLQKPIHLHRFFFGHLGPPLVPEGLYKSYKIRIMESGPPDHLGRLFCEGGMNFFLMGLKRRQMASLFEKQGEYRVFDKTEDFGVNRV
jgi:hypothetical protein